MPQRRHRVRPRGLLLELVARAVGRGQAMISAGDRLPLVLTSFPRGRARFAAALRTALQVTFPALPPRVQALYADVLDRTPPLIVADLRAYNPCTCLGHHHPESNYTAITRRLAAEASYRIGEIDLAVDAIRDWEPHPLASLAVDGQPLSSAELARLRFEAALLSVFLHELEHVAYPERPESEIRARSDGFYLAALRERLSRDFGVGFGLDPALQALP